MSIVKEFILECDLFAHNSLQRYKQQQGFRTIIGGLTSIIIIILFFIVFFNLVINTFSMKIINSQVSTTYDDDPNYSQLTTDPSKNYMFAIGISGIDLSSTQRYFDIVLNNRTTIKNGSTTSKSSKNIPLTPCTGNQWSGVTDSIKNSYTSQSFNQWLCPPVGTVIPLQGKFTSNTFKFAQLVISQCTANALYPNTTCKSDGDIMSFLGNNTQFTVNIYFINPVINAGDSNYITYYLEDSNFFSFDLFTGISANLYHNDYKITTDNSIMPWIQNRDEGSIQVTSTAIGQTFAISSKNEYFKFNWRKAANKAQITRTFQKLDQTLSYIGGLFGTIVLLLIFLKFYSKYSYELDIGEKIFKSNNGGSFGAENFNFIVFIGYSVFNMVSKFGIILNWKTMKKFHKCRDECQKQLNIDLLYKKISHFEEISKIVLEDHHLKMLLMAPKPTIKEAKLNRKRYLIKSVIYHQLERKGKDYYISRQQHRERHKNFLEIERDFDYRQIAQGQEDYDETSIRAILEDFMRSYKKTNAEDAQNNKLSKKIIERLRLQKIISNIFQIITSKVINDKQYNKGPQKVDETYSIQIIHGQPKQNIRSLNQNEVLVKNPDEITQTRLMHGVLQKKR